MTKTMVFDPELCCGKQVRKQEPAQRSGDIMQMFDLRKHVPVIHLQIASFTPTKASAIIRGHPCQRFAV
jgi:hypothetical protein